MNTITFKVTGGIDPGEWRSTSVEVLTDDLALADNSIDIWARRHFPDWNHISRLHHNCAALITIKPIVSIPIHRQKSNANASH